ncbi:hypothetical protein GQ53DRAFT_52 [Thozetella sp. PMI_491]|nr:hypothetical protein GQ53DRAFT_52 [Thozetella sp. PMI_491]
MGLHVALFRRRIPGRTSLPLLGGHLAMSRAERRPFRRSGKGRVSPAHLRRRCIMASIPGRHCSKRHGGRRCGTTQRVRQWRLEPYKRGINGVNQGRQPSQPCRMSVPGLLPWTCVRACEESVHFPNPIRLRPAAALA